VVATEYLADLEAPAWKDQHHFRLMTGRCFTDWNVCDVAGYLADLEAPAWKDQRHFRLMTAYKGTFSVSEVYFNTHRRPPSLEFGGSKLHSINGTAFSVAGMFEMQASVGLDSPLGRGRRSSS
jgi:hypothetical protein